MEPTAIRTNKDTKLEVSRAPSKKPEEKDDLNLKATHDTTTKNNSAQSLKKETEKKHPKRK
jgi:hypothetical protein